MEKKADIILRGAAVYCGKGLRRDYDFVAITGNKILGLGISGDEKAYIGPDTKVIELMKDQFVMPGLHDHHIHLIQAGMLDKYVDLTEAKSQEEAAAAVARFAATIPNETWVIGFGWSRLGWRDKSLPVKESLDSVIKDRPVFLLDSELHGAWVNSKALEVCGVTGETESPAFGEIAKNQDGEPSGYLYETALCLVGKYAFDFSSELVRELINRYMNNAVRWGITSVSDMTPYLGLNLAFEDTYFKMDRAGELKIRINAARNLFEDIPTFLRIRTEAEQSGTGMYRVPYMKQFLDGVIANYTAMMIDDYDDRQGEKGSPLLDLYSLDQAVEAAHKNGISVRLHACGDGAVRTALDAYERVGKGEDLRVHHQIEHIESIDPVDIPRFAKLGVIASVQPEHIVSGIPSYDDNCYPELLGPERERYTWPFQTMLDSGTMLACGSDAPVVEGDPFFGMYCGMERIHPDGSPVGGWNPSEKLSIEELIHGYTYGAAFAEGREDELGTLEIGKLADITIVDRNLLACSSSEIRDTKVRLTIVDGRIVYNSKHA